MKNRQEETFLVTEEEVWEGERAEHADQGLSILAKSQSCMVE